MKRLMFPLLAGLLAARLTAFADVTWNTDLIAAQAQAKKEKKLVLMNFTGSDWCGFCIQLKKDVFDTKEFAAYAKDKLVMVEIDFPRTKKQSPELVKANEKLSDKFGPAGYPTIVVLNSDGKEVWRNSGHNLGGPKGWIAKLDSLK